MNKSSNQEYLNNLRHSCAHLLAAAVMKLWPNAKRAIGPAIENGFYFDFDFGGIKISEKDFPKIEKEMRELVKNWSKFDRQELTAAQAKKDYPNNPYKHEMIDEFSEKGKKKISFYKSGDYRDLCRGGHIDNPKKELQHFKLLSVAGAYWRGSEKNQMLTRIYGTCWPSKAELEAYLKQQKEAEKRDHKKLGKELDLYAFSPLVGAGLPLFLPKGETIFHELEEFMREEKEKLGYKFLHIPHIAKAELFKKSGHLGKYDAMMPIMTDNEGNEFVLKAMNCPHHFEAYLAQPHSYRDLPYRMASTATVYRNEKSGELSGLTRVKSLTIDDTHHIVRPDQIQSEIEMILKLMNKIYKTFGFKDYSVQISVRDPDNKKKYFGNDKVWERSEAILIESVKKWGRPYVIEKGEAAFYGPKIDIMVKDSIGRPWQLTTVQLDFNQPENFHLRFTGKDGKEYPPSVLHVAILGSIERFMGVLIEHFAGAFPLWLSPVQVAVLPISDKQVKFSQGVVDELEQNNIRVEFYNKAESIGKKIREAEINKIPYMLIVGEKEAKSKSVSVRARNHKDLGNMKIDKFVQRVSREIETKKI
ncbi:MAG: threonine--tRNA ligase [Candidatus Doudnabacteria bacterium]|nr:threonine--tRNA ligase [Candidatus Doudnabacteria bacterium]